MTFDEWFDKDADSFDQSVMATTSLWVRKLWAREIWRVAQASINNQYDCDDLLEAVSHILYSGHMNTEDLARLRAAYEVMP